MKVVVIFSTNVSAEIYGVFNLQPGCYLGYSSVTIQPLKHTCLQIRIERVVPQSQQPVSRDFQQASLTLDCHISEKHKRIICWWVLTI